MYHALCGVVEPFFERGFIHYNHANRQGKAARRTVARYEKFQDRFRDVLCCESARALVVSTPSTAWILVAP